LITAFEFGIEMKITFLSSLFSEDDHEEIFVCSNSFGKTIPPQKFF